MATYINYFELFAAINYPTVKSQKGSEDLCKALKFGSKEEQKEALAVIDQRLKLFSDALTGVPLPGQVTDFFAPVRKNFVNTSSVTTTTVNTHDALFNSLRIDIKWMQFFEMVDARGSNTLEILQLANHVTFKEYRHGQKIEPVPFGDDDIEYLRERRWGAALNFLNRWVETNGRYNINDAMQRFMIAAMVIKANTTYTDLADTAGISTETFDTNIITTANNAAVTLLTTLADNEPSYEVTDDTPLLWLLNSQHKAVVNAAFRTISGDNGSNILLEYNIQPVFTFNSNVAGDLGTGTNCGMMVLPGEDNIFATYKSMNVGSESSIQTDSVIWVAQDYWNDNVAAVQKLITNIA